MHIFLTGGTGFLGSNFLNYLTDKKVFVTALKREAESKTKIALKKEPEWIIGSLDNFEEKCLENKNLLVHFAAHSAQPPYDSLQNCIQKNVIEPLNLFEKAYDSGIRKFLISGSCFEYGLSANNHRFIPPNAQLLPIDTYPASKAIASIAFIQWAIEKEVSLSIKRLFYIYGKGEKESRFYPSLKNAAREGLDFEMSKGEQIRDISEINHVISILYKECIRISNSKQNDIRIENIGSGNNLSIKDFASKIWAQNKAKGKLIFGKVPYRKREIMRYVPQLNRTEIIKKFY